MRGSGLRSQLFRAIGVVVLICVALTIGLGVLLTHRAVEHATLKDLGQQADVVAAAQSSGVSPVVSISSSGRCSARRRIALIRAASSRGEKGFGT